MPAMLVVKVMRRVRMHPGRLLSMPAIQHVESEEGASLTETAVTVSIMIGITLGIFIAGLAFYTSHVVSDAARQGSRYAIVRGSQSCSNTPNLTNCNATADEVKTWVKNLGYPGLNVNNVTVTVSWLRATTSGSPATTTWSNCASGTCNAPGNLVKVVVTYAYPMKIPFVTKNSNTVNVASTSEMAISQ